MKAKGFEEAALGYSAKKVPDRQMEISRCTQFKTLTLCSIPTDLRFRSGLTVSGASWKRSWTASGRTCRSRRSGPRSWRRKRRQ